MSVTATRLTELGAPLRDRIERSEGLRVVLRVLPWLGVLGGGGSALHSLKIVLRSEGLDEGTNATVKDAVYVVDR